jgi:hypothetical protein
MKDSDKKNKTSKKNKEFSDKDILLSNLDIVSSGLFACRNKLQTECSIGFARYLNHVGINRDNYKIFLKMIETNNKFVIDELIGKREAKLLFSTIPSNNFIIKRAFSTLSFYHPNEIYSKALEALLGIIENAYYDVDDGYTIYELKIMDINTVGKFLDENTPELPSNIIILDILDKMSRIGQYNRDGTKNILANHAFNIRFAFFDNTRDLTDTIPQLLLIGVDREETEVKPSKEYIRFLKET